MQAKSIAKVFATRSNFVDRVIQVNHQDRAALSWQINDQTRIQRRHWFALARHVVTCDDPAQAAWLRRCQNEAGSGRGLTLIC